LYYDHQEQLHESRFALAQTDSPARGGQGLGAGFSAESISVRASVKLFFLMTN